MDHANTVSPAPSELVSRLANPAAVRYIKLGKGGSWSSEAIANGTIPFGFSQVDHAPCARGDWEAVVEELRDGGRTGGGISQGRRELQDFYEQGDRCLWVTFADGHLYWAFAAPQVEEVAARDADKPTRYRRTLDGWRRHSITGQPLAVRSLSSALTRVAGYRMTICAVEREAYLLRRIRGEEEPLLAEAQALRGNLEDVATRLISALDWRDFEIMVELIFTRGGWQRQSALGVGEVDIDLLLDQPTTGETAWVQIKSRADQSVLDDYLRRFQRDGSADRFFFVCHSPSGTLTSPDSEKLHVWAGRDLASRAIGTGLLDWVMERAR